MRIRGIRGIRRKRARECRGSVLGSAQEEGEKEKVKQMKKIEGEIEEEGLRK